MNRIDKIIEREFAQMKGLTSDGKRFISESQLRALLQEVTEEYRKDAERYRWLRMSALPMKRPNAEEMTLGYQPIRLKVETMIYKPDTWGIYVDKTIDAAIVAEGK